MKREIAFICMQKHDDVNAWSGTTYYLANMLKNEGYSLTYIDDLYPPTIFKALIKLKQIILKFMCGGGKHSFAETIGHSCGINTK